MRQFRRGIGKNVRADEKSQFAQAFRIKTFLHQVFTECQHTLDDAAADAAIDLIELRARLDAQDLAQAVGIGVQVIRAQVIVAAAGAGDGRHVLRLGGGLQLLHEVQFLVRHAGGANDGDLVAGQSAQAFAHGVHRLLPRGAFVLAAHLDHGFGKPELAVDKMEVETALVAHPGGVDVVVLTRRLPVERVATGTDLRVATAAALGAEGVRLLHEPHAHLEPEIVRSQGAHGTDVHGVERVVVLQTTPGMHCQRGVRAALGEAQHWIVRDLVGETDAAAAHDAALVVQTHTRTNIDVLRLLRFVFTEAALGLAVLNTELLKATLPSLVADWAVQRMVGQQKLHHPAAAFFRELAFGANAQAFRHRVRTGDHGAGHPGNDRHAMLILGRLLAGRRTWRHAHLHKAHAAVAGRTQFGMVAVMRHLGFSLTAGFDHSHAFGELVPRAVDLHVDHVYGRLGCGCAGGFRHKARKGGLRASIRAGERRARRICEIFHKRLFRQRTKTAAGDALQCLTV